MNSRELVEPNQTRPEEKKKLAEAAGENRHRQINRVGCVEFPCPENKKKCKRRSVHGNATEQAFHGQACCNGYKLLSTENHLPHVRPSVKPPYAQMPRERRRSKTS